MTEGDGYTGTALLPSSRDASESGSAPSVEKGQGIVRGSTLIETAHPGQAP